MEPEIRTLVEIGDSMAALQSRADIVLERARWASSIFQRLDRDQTMAIVDHVAKVAHANADKYAKWAVEETGFGVVEHKKLKNELTTVPLVDYYRDQDFVNAQIDPGRKIVRIPRPAGVILALTPSTNPIATVNFKVLMALMTRNTIVVSPHPAARECCIDAVLTLADAAVAAGAPNGCIQVIEDPSIPLIEEFMGSPKTSLILATGGTAMVRSAYSSSNPAIGVGPGNAPVFVHTSADINKAAQRIVDSKSFDNSILCTNESVLITLPEADSKLRQALKQSGAHLCSDEETERLRRLLFHANGFNVACIGRDATWIANECGFRVPSKTKILVTPILQIGVEERLSREKLCPVLAYHVANNQKQALAQARAVLRLSGAGHSAAVHTMDEQVAIDYAHAVEAYRVVVNAPCSQGASGFETHLAPTFTIGTGYFGRSSVGENIGPQHLVHWTQMAYNSDVSATFGDYSAVNHRFEGPLPEAPSGGLPEPAARKSAPPSVNLSQSSVGGLDATARAELRKLIAQEIRDALKGGL